MIAQMMKMSAALLDGSASHHALLSAFWMDEAGGSQMEWALMASLVSLFAVASLQNLAARIGQAWQTVVTSFNASI